jgi:hypothetical protein
MSLRKVLGADVDRVHEQVDTLLDREDAMLILVDGSRAISYAHGFGISPSQLEFLALEIEKAVRSIAGPALNHSTDARQATEIGSSNTGSHRDAAVCRPDPVKHGRPRQVGDELERAQRRVFGEGSRTNRAFRGLDRRGGAPLADREDVSKIS